MEGWLTRIATNTCLNLIRGAKRRPELTLSNLSEDESSWLDAQLSEVAAERHRSAERNLVAADFADPSCAAAPNSFANIKVLGALALLAIDTENWFSHLCKYPCMSG